MKHADCMFINFWKFEGEQKPYILEQQPVYGWENCIADYEQEPLSATYSHTIVLKMDGTYETFDLKEVLEEQQAREDEEDEREAAAYAAEIARVQSHLNSQRL